MFKSYTTKTPIYCCVWYLTGILGGLTSLTVAANDQTGQASSFSPTLVQLQQTAIARSPELASQMLTNQIALVDVTLAKNQWLPEVSANLNKSYGRSNGAFDDTSVANRKVNEAGAVGFSISQKLYDPIISIDIEQAKLSAQSSKYLVSQLYDELTSRVVALFFDILATQAAINLLDNQLKAVEEQKKQAQLSFEVGTVSITDVKEAEAKHDTLVAQLNVSKLQMQAKQAELSILTGLTINPLDYVSSTKVLPNISQNDFAKWSIELSQNNEQLKQAVINYQLAQLETDKLAYKHYPKVQFVVKNNYNLPPWSQKARSNYSNNQWDWSAGVQVDVPLFNTNTSQAQATKIALTEAKRLEEVWQAREQQTIELQQTFYQILASIAEYQGLYEAKASAKTALLANMLGYQVGMRINADVLDAQAKVYEADKDQLVAWYDTWRNYIKLNQLAGTLDIEQLAQIDTILRQTVPDRNELSLMESLNE